MHEPPRRCRRGQRQQKNILGEQVRAEACRCLAGKYLAAKDLTAEDLTEGLRQQGLGSGDIARLLPIDERDRYAEARGETRTAIGTHRAIVV